MVDYHLSEHFTLADLTRSARAKTLGVSNNPDAEQIANLRRLCALLEVIHEHVGSWYVTSGFRCAALNGQTPGSSRTSAHQLGLAADGVPICQWHPGTLADIIAWARDADLPYDQIIYEAVPGRDAKLSIWVHVGIAPEGRIPRRAALVTWDGKRYLPFDPAIIDRETGRARVA